ncbi:MULTISPECIES: hypothetical protein [Chromobacterium]|nr:MULTISPECIES: hypothetical protein [Chromobacterium]WON82832.1 hypothetical protein OK026_17000 [Chromobacterium haemolyticum]
MIILTCGDGIILGCSFVLDGLASGSETVVNLNATDLLPQKRSGEK